MATIGFVTESTADFPDGLAEKFNINIIPIHVIVDTIDYKDGVDIKNEDVVKFMKQKRDVSTRAPAPAEYADFYENLLKKYDYILSFQIASNLSECHQSAKNSLSLLDPELAKRIKIFNTRSLSIGQAIYTLKAIEIFRKEKKIAGLEEKVNFEMDTIINNFTVDSMAWLKKSGRIGTLGAAFGSMFHIKPLIALKDSELKAVGKVRGMNNVIKEMASYAGKTKKKTGFNYDVWVTHCEAPEDADLLMESLAKELEIEKKEIKLVRAGASISVQIGPGSFAWGMIRK